MTEPEEREEPDHCGHEDGELVADPFIAEVYDKIVMRWLCHDCQQERRDEV